jgi:hypothetical protein
VSHELRGSRLYSYFHPELNNDEKWRWVPNSSDRNRRDEIHSAATMKPRKYEGHS